MAEIEVNDVVCPCCGEVFDTTVEIEPQDLNDLD